jgi:hypothetical protein
MTGGSVGGTDSFFKSSLSFRGLQPVERARKSKASRTNRESFIMTPHIVFNTAKFNDIAIITSLPSD